MYDVCARVCTRLRYDVYHATMVSDFQHVLRMLVYFLSRPLVPNVCQRLSLCVPSPYPISICLLVHHRNDDHVYRVALLAAYSADF